VRLTDKERLVLFDHLSMHLQGVLETIEQIEADEATFDTLEDYINAVGTVQGDKHVLLGILERLGDELAHTPRQRATRSVRTLLQDLRRNAERGAGSRTHRFV
jgi:hypothetical protein